MLFIRKKREFLNLELGIGRNEVNDDVLTVDSKNAGDELILGIGSSKDKDVMTDLYGAMAYPLACLHLRGVEKTFQIADFILHSKKMT
jgi:hypothetical protein